MNAVKNNPYRTLGLFGNSTEKELQKQIATIKRFAEVGKIKVFDYDFPFFGEVVRSTEMVQEAASKIEQAKNKVHYALFWFLNSGHIDEAALNNLKEGHIEKATEIWEKTLKDSTVTAKNFAAISNLSTLQLGIVTYNGSFDPEKFAASIELKGKLIMSDACDSFIKTVIGEGISINRETILKEFADEVMQIIKPYLLKPAEKTGLIDGVMDNGIGLYRWENGDLYFGEWKDGKRTGFGTYLWGSGHSFTGHFNLGELHGEGVYLYPNGVKNIGEWASGKYQVNQNYNSDEIQRKIKDRFVELKKQSGIPFNSITIVQFINSFRSFPNEIKQYVKSKFTEKPISSIEAKIETCKENRDINPSDAAKFGEELFSKTKSDLTLLKNVSGEGDVQFQMISNKVAQEILQCSIDFFNIHNKEGLFDPFDDSLKIAKYAKSLNPTGQVKNRVEEALETLEEMRYRDAHEIIGFFKQILGVFNEIAKENLSTGALLSGRRKVLNEEKIMEIARPLLDDRIVEKIAKSGKDNLIKDFYDSIKMMPLICFGQNSDFFNKKIAAFISYLPITNSVKFNFEKSKLENEIDSLQKELTNTKNKKMYSSEIQTLETQMSSIKEWQMFRSRETRESQIAVQQQKINSLVTKGETEKKKEISRIEEQLVIKRRELKSLTEQNN